MLCRPMSCPSTPHKLCWALLLRFPSCEASTHFHYFGAELISAVFFCFVAASNGIAFRILLLQRVPVNYIFATRGST